MLYNHDDIDKITNLVKKRLNNDSINKEMILFVIDEFDNIDKITDKINVLLNPKEMEEKNFYKYLSLMKEIIASRSLNLYFYKEIFPKIKKENIDNKIYNLMKLILYYSTCHFNEFIGSMGIITIIIGYLYANDINDYSILNNFINDSNYYYEKLKINGISFYEDLTSEIESFPIYTIYNSIDIFKTKEGKIIK